MEDVFIYCALRFDGYAYAESRGIELPSLSVPFVESLTFWPDVLDNFATFFALQRFLGKWGGEMSLSLSRANKAFKLMFFHLCREDVPERYRSPEYDRAWCGRFVPHLGRQVASLRRKFRKQLALENEIAEAGGKLTPNGWLFMPSISEDNETGTTFLPNIYTWQPGAFAAVSSDPDSPLSEIEPLTMQQRAALKSNLLWVPVRRYFDFLKVKSAHQRLGSKRHVQRD